MRSTESKARGFSLVELLIAMTLGLIVLAATTQLFKRGMDATRAGFPVVRNAAECSRHAEPGRQGREHGGFRPALGRFGSCPTAPGDAFILCGGCASLAGQQYLSHRRYRRSSSHQFHVRHYSRRRQRHGAWRTGHVTATGKASDAITVIYADYAFPLNQYTATFPAANPNGDVVTFAPPAVPAGRFPAIQSPTGLQVGD